MNPAINFATPGTSITRHQLLETSPSLFTYLAWRSRELSKHVVFLWPRAQSRTKQTENSNWEANCGPRCILEQFGLNLLTSRSERRWLGTRRDARRSINSALRHLFKERLACEKADEKKTKMNAGAWSPRRLSLLQGRRENEATKIYPRIIARDKSSAVGPRDRWCSCNEFALVMRPAARCITEVLSRRRSRVRRLFLYFSATINWSALRIIVFSQALLRDWQK